MRWEDRIAYTVDEGITLTDAECRLVQEELSSFLNEAYRERSGSFEARAFEDLRAILLRVFPFAEELRTTDTGDGTGEHPTTSSLWPKSRE